MNGRTGDGDGSRRWAADASGCPEGDDPATEDAAAGEQEQDDDADESGTGDEGEPGAEQQ